MKKIILLFFFLPNLIFAQKQEVKSSDEIGETEYFEFHSNYLLNLHHWLFQKGLQYNKAEAKDFKTILGDETKTEIDQNKMQNVLLAIKYYADSIVSKNLLFDPELTRLKYNLERIVSLNSDEAKEIPVFIKSALESAGDYFNQFVWNDMNARNTDFVKTKIETVAKIEKQVISDCMKYYHYKYDGRKFRIDITDYATFFGAYTTSDPYINAVISSADKRHEGTQGVEVIFHEVSHGMIDTVYELQEKICEEMKTQLDHNIWHSILFYSTGTFVKNALAKEGKEHEIYFYRNNLTALSPQFKKVIDSVAKNWQNYLNGKITIEKAVRRILTDSKK